MMKTIVRVSSVAIMMLLLTACCGTSINSSIQLADGEKRTGGLNSVNGSITIGRNCDVQGECGTVNGYIRVGEGSSVGSLGTVNGGISVDADVSVDGDVGTVNGAVNCGAGATVNGEISTINGEIVLENAHAGKDVSTCNGDILLKDHSRVAGDLVVEKTMGSNSQARRELRIEILDGSVVEGNVLVHEDDLEVVVTISGGGEVQGEIIGARVVD